MRENGTLALYRDGVDLTNVGNELSVGLARPRAMGRRPGIGLQRNPALFSTNSPYYVPGR